MLICQFLKQKLIYKKFKIPNPFEYLLSESDGDKLTKQEEANVTKLVYVGGLTITIACGYLFGNVEKHAPNLETNKQKTETTK